MYILKVFLIFVKIIIMEKLKDKISEKISEYTPIGKAFCEGKCDRKPIITEKGMVLVCDGCNRVVIDNRD